MRGSDSDLGFADVAWVIATHLHSSGPSPVINMSGIILHTGLGRARLAPSVVQRVQETAANHALVEFDSGSGLRGDRQDHVNFLLTRLTGAESALVVNNCAAAVLLSLAALGDGQEVILSRGQMIEIGGAFRMPDVIRQSGCKLVEVGCTNKTRLSDFEQAITEETRILLRCHPSNFRIVGFHAEPSARDLAELAHKHGKLLIDDVGSGCLIDTTQFGLPKERTIQDALKDGADLVLASGDKLLGGPQAGLILGSKVLISKLARHPLARAVRIDKLSLTALEATLRLYLENRYKEIPAWRYCSRPLQEVHEIAKRLGSRVEEGTTELGGGSLPEQGVPTWRVGLPGQPDEILAKLRKGATPIIGYIRNGTAWLDPRTIEEDEVILVEQKLKHELGR